MLQFKLWYVYFNYYDDYYYHFTALAILPGTSRVSQYQTGKTETN